MEFMNQARQVLGLTYERTVLLRLHCAENDLLLVEGKQGLGGADGAAGKFITES